MDNNNYIKDDTPMYFIALDGVKFVVETSPFIKNITEEFLGIYGIGSFASDNKTTQYI